METVAQLSGVSHAVFVRQRDQAIGRINRIMEQFAARSVKGQTAENLACEGMRLILGYGFSVVDRTTFLNHARSCISNERLKELKLVVES